MKSIIKKIDNFLNEGKELSMDKVIRIFNKVEKEMKKIKTDDDYGDFLDSIPVDNGADLFDQYWSSADKVHYHQRLNPGLIELLKYFDKEL